MRLFGSICKQLELVNKQQMQELCWQGLETASQFCWSDHTSGQAYEPYSVVSGAGGERYSGSQRAHQYLGCKQESLAPLDRIKADPQSQSVNRQPSDMHPASTIKSTKSTQTEQTWTTAKNKQSKGQKRQRRTKKQLSLDWQCPACSKKYSQRPALRLHITNKHPSDKEQVIGSIALPPWAHPSKGRPRKRDSQKPAPEGYR